MKVPKKMNRYCPKCNKHTEHKVYASKKTGKRGTLKHGSIARARKRGHRGMGNLGRWGSKPTKPKMSGKKTSKKTDFRFECSNCKKSWVQFTGTRARKIEFAEA